MLIYSFFVKHRAKFRLDLGFYVSSDFSTINNPKKGKNSRQQKENDNTSQTKYISLDDKSSKITYLNTGKVDEKRITLTIKKTQKACFEISKENKN